MEEQTELNPAEEVVEQEVAGAVSSRDDRFVEQEELMRIRMNGEEFLVPVREVAEIIRPLRITKVPMAPDHLLGVANIRGQIVCIIDPGKVLHLKEARKEKSDTTRFLILRHARMHLGVWVDEVTALYRVNKDSLPEQEEGQKGHIRGEMDVDGTTFRLLKISALFN